jgi:hypothetical protein
MQTALSIAVRIVEIIIQLRACRKSVRGGHKSAAGSGDPAIPSALALSCVPDAFMLCACLRTRREQ